MHTLFDVGQVRVAREVPRNILDAINASTPIREVF
jgi:hypothetical protein